MSMLPVVPGDRPPNSDTPFARPSMPISCMQLPFDSMHVLFVHAVANELPHSATLPEAHDLHVAPLIWFSICVASWPSSVPVNAPMNAPPKMHRMPPLSEMSAPSSCVTDVLLAWMRVVPVIASCTKWICVSTWRYGTEPCVESSATVQSMPE